MPETTPRSAVRMSRCVRPHVHGMYKMQSIVIALQFSDRVRLTIVLLAHPPPLSLSLSLTDASLRHPPSCCQPLCLCILCRLFSIPSSPSRSFISKRRLSWFSRCCVVIVLEHSQLSSLSSLKDLLEVRRCKVSQQRNRLRLGGGLRFY